MYGLTVRIVSAVLGIGAVVVLGWNLEWQAEVGLTSFALVVALFGLGWSFLDGIEDLRRFRQSRRRIAKGNDLALIQARELLLGLESSDTSGCGPIVQRYLRAFTAELRDEIRLREEHQYAARQRATR